MARKRVIDTGVVIDEEFNRLVENISIKSGELIPYPIWRRVKDQLEQTRERLKHLL